MLTIAALHILQCVVNNPESHGQCDKHASKEGESPCWLGDGTLVGEGVEHSGDEKAPEVPRGPPGVGIGQHVHVSDHQEHWDVLKVIQVVPV